MNYEGIDWVWRYEDISHRSTAMGIFLSLVFLAIFVGTIVYLFTDYSHYIKIMGSASAAKGALMHAAARALSLFV